MATTAYRPRVVAGHPRLSVLAFPANGEKGLLSKGTVPLPSCHFPPLAKNESRVRTPAG